MDSRHVPPMLLVACMVLTLYGAGYLWLVEPVPTFFTGTYARYQTAVGNQRFWGVVFGPANAIDRKVRPQTWARLNVTVRPSSP